MFCYVTEARKDVGRLKGNSMVIDCHRLRADKWYTNISRYYLIFDRAGLECPLYVQCCSHFICQIILFFVNDFKVI